MVYTQSPYDISCSPDAVMMRLHGMKNILLTIFPALVMICHDRSSWCCIHSLLLVFSHSAHNWNSTVHESCLLDFRESSGAKHTVWTVALPQLRPSIHTQVSFSKLNAEWNTLCYLFRKCSLKEDIHKIFLKCVLGGFFCIIQLMFIVFSKVMVASKLWLSTKRTTYNLARIGVFLFKNFRFHDASGVS
jgi:hypothetical protein